MVRWFSTWGTSSSRSSSPSPPSARVVKCQTAMASPVRPSHNHNHDNTATTTTTTSSSTTTTTNACSVDSPARRRRLNSRDYPRSYSGQYGQTDDLLPLELHRHRQGAVGTAAVPMMIGLYITVVLVIQLLVALVLLVPAAERGVVTSPLSWTVSNAIHTALTLLYVHWLKGSLYDDAGEMNALTVWEQMEANGADSRPVREAFMVMPCLLAWVACHAADYSQRAVAVNLVLWAACLLPKMSFLNGVRLFGINRTAGIDDIGDGGGSSTAGSSSVSEGKTKTP